MTESYDQAETFEPRSSIKRATLTNGLVLFIPLAAVTWVIVTLIFSGIGVPVPWLFGILVGGAFMFALHVAKSRKLDALVAGCR